MKRPGPPAAAGQVRVIAGRWRGSKLPVAGRDGLRPTSDRVRETLFNWLAPVLHGARCLDLFAGSGALGFEAGSRGAARVLMVERDPQLAASLQATAARLVADAVEVRCADALRVLQDEGSERFDIVFVDPPFAAGLWPAVLERLPRRLADDAWIYLEAPLAAPPAVPAGWQLHREGQTREVRYALYRSRSSADAAAG
jgi:16S rRNA (guanine966-N2)-methyltransferase